MNTDIKLFKWLGIIILIPIVLAVFGGDRFRYPCQDPANWEKDICKLPLCDVTRTCPQHIFKGQRDPRLGPEDIKPAPVIVNQPLQCPAKGESCGK